MKMYNYSNSFFRSIVAVLLMVLVTISANAQHFTDFEFVETAPANIRQSMQNNTKAVFRQIHEAHFGKKPGITLSRNNATPDAIDRIQSLWSTSKFYCIETDLIARVLQTPRGYQVRNIPVIFVDGATNEDKYQDIVLEFASDGKISDIYIAIPMHQYYNIIETGSEVTDMRRRQLILGFVENFHTSYYLKDIDFITKIFSNDVLPRQRVDSPRPIGTDVQYVEHSKSQYIDNLRSAFVRNSFINTKFDEIEVMKDEEKGHIYGVTLRQQWNSSTYKDGGWFFMIVDFRDEDYPIIWVRTWQPLEVSRNDVFGLSDFNLNNI